MEPVRDRPWSTVWRAETSRGVFYAKQNTPLQGFEAPLMAVLADLAPDHVVPVTAVDEGRDLLLTPDQGLVLGDSADGLSDDAAIELALRVVLAGAALQREVAPHADMMSAAGLTRLGPLDVVAYVEQRLDDFARLPSDDPRALSSEAATRVSEYLPQLARESQALAECGLPLTLQHNDLHQFNVFDVDGELRFFDFGDALLSDPLAALWVPLGGLAHRLGCSVSDPRVQKVADVALECWTDFAPLAVLRDVLPAALRLGRLSRAESYVRCFASMSDEELVEYGDAAAYWLEAVANLEL
jgi:hypothetical protein